MEQNLQKQKKNMQSKGWWIGAGCLLLSAVAIYFGLHPYYRFVSLFYLSATMILILKRGWWRWISSVMLFGFVAFLWSFGPSGYRYASFIPFTIGALILVFHFCSRGICTAVSILVGLGLCGLLIVETPILNEARRTPDRKADYIIVLGAAVYGEEPSIALRNRVACAEAYLNEHPDTKVVVSGGKGDGENISEAECMRRYLIEHKIASSRILLEDHSTSTVENLAFSKAVIESDGGSVHHVAIVSSSYHLYRAKSIAESLGIPAMGLASSDGYPIFMCGMYIREALGVLKMWIFGGWEQQVCLASVYAARVR